MLNRNDLIVRITERLDGRLSDRALAAWAFDCFYAIEQGEEEAEAGANDLIAEVLDELMFADDESFALDDADLKRLIARLEQP